MNHQSSIEALNEAMKEIGNMIPCFFNKDTWKAVIPLYKVDRVLHKHGIDIEYGRAEFVCNCENSLWTVSIDRPFVYLFQKCYVLTYDKEIFK